MNNSSPSLNNPITSDSKKVNVEYLSYKTLEKEEKEALEKGKESSLRKILIILSLILLVFIVSFWGYLLISNKNKLISKIKPKQNNNTKVITDRMAKQELNSPISNRYDSYDNKLQELNVTQTQKADLTDYVGKRLIDENSDFAVFIVNVKTNTPDYKRGNIIVYDKKKKEVIEITGEYVIFENSQVDSSRDKKYIMIRSSSKNASNVIVISLDRKKQVAVNFCASSSGGAISIWNHYLIYTSCTNSPNTLNKGAITAINLDNNKKIVLIKRSGNETYVIYSIKGNNLYYYKTTKLGQGESTLQTYNLKKLVD